jgi:hypothetical protein
MSLFDIIFITLSCVVCYRKKDNNNNTDEQ